MLAVFVASFLLGCVSPRINDLVNELGSIHCDIRYAVNSQNLEQTNEALDAMYVFWRENKDEIAMNKGYSSFLSGVDLEMERSCGSSSKECFKDLGDYLMANDPERYVEFRTWVKEF